MGRPVVHFELWSQNPQKLSEFYAKVFDWKTNHLPEMDYRLVETGGEGGINGGIMTPKQGPWPSNMTFYISVDDLATYTKRIVDAGGKLVVDRMDMPGVGALALFEDTGGRVIGIWQQLQHG